MEYDTRQQEFKSKKHGSQHNPPIFSPPNNNLYRTTKNLYSQNESSQPIFNKNNDERKVLNNKYGNFFTNSNVTQPQETYGNKVPKRFNPPKIVTPNITSFGEREKSPNIITTQQEICDFIPKLPLYNDPKEFKALEILTKQEKYKNLMIQKKIGYGGFSNVYLAVQRDMGFNTNTHQKDYKSFSTDNNPKRYAIKVVDGKKITPSEILSGMVLDHPNIVRMKDWFPIENHYYLIFEFINGVDLQVLWNKYGAFPEKYFRGIFKQIISALSYCHKLGVVHRDIKFENMIVYGEDMSKLKLVDFGFSFFLKAPPKPANMEAMPCIANTPLYSKGKLTEENKFVGTQGYCAPEIILGAISNESNLIPTEMYSLGVVLFCALVGHFPMSQQCLEFINKASDFAVEKGKNPASLLQNNSFCTELITLSKLNFFNAKISSHAKDLIIKMLHPLSKYRVSLQDVENHPWLKEEMDHNLVHKPEFRTKSFDHNVYEKLENNGKRNYANNVYNNNNNNATMKDKAFKNDSNLVDKHTNFHMKEKVTTQARDGNINERQDNENTECESDAENESSQKNSLSSEEEEEEEEERESDYEDNEKQKKNKLQSEGESEG